MKFIPTRLEGAYVIEVDPARDFRGFFARLWCRQEFEKQGISMDLVQVSVSHNALAGTLRGLHFQWPPSVEAKLVRCERGRIYDVIVDLRPDSSTFSKHFAVELDSQSHRSLYVPPGFAHGFQTLLDNSDIVYMMSDYHRPELADGVRYNDPQFGIDWPIQITNSVERDRNYPDFNPQDFSRRFMQAT